MLISFYNQWGGGGGAEGVLMEVEWREQPNVDEVPKENSGEGTQDLYDPLIL